MSWDQFVGRGVEYSASPAESKRFGVTFGRVTVLTDDAASSMARLGEVLRTAPEDVLVVRYPAAELGLGAVVATSGRDVIPAGALTYWGALAADVVARPVDPADPVEVVNASEWTGKAGSGDGADTPVGDVVDAMVAESFAGYGNHYVANPLLDRGAALAGYQEWARLTVSAHPEDALLLRRGAQVIGIATCHASPENDHLEILLAGLSPSAQNRGLYGHLLAGCATHAGHRGLARLIISTQVHNVRVQRAWARAGLLPFGAVETVHCVRPGVLAAPSPTS